MTARDFIPHLDTFIKTQEEISGHWNGSDAQYIGADGSAYTEDDATTAQERADAAKKLKAEIEQHDL